MLRRLASAQRQVERMIRPLVLASLILASGPAGAADGRGYVEGEAGMFLPIESSATGAYLGQDATITYTPGVVLAAAGGYQFKNGVRGEGELDFRRVTTDRMSTPAGRISADGDLRSYGFMANLYYDVITRTAVTPYVGGGVGLAVADFGRGSSKGAPLWNPGHDLSVAYQGIGGFLVRLTERTSLDLASHHYAIPRVHLDTLSADFRGINLCAGIRHWF